MKKYIFKPYNPIFHTLFISEKKRLKKFLPDNACIEHIGSTAVPKEHLKSAEDAIKAAGYDFRERASTLNEHLFFKQIRQDPLEGSRTYHVHLSYPEYNDWKSALAFRDYLRSHPEAVQQYAAIKERAAMKANDDKDSYMKIKAPFIAAILKNLTTKT